MTEFCGLDSNYKWISDCGSICCEQKHNIRVNKVMTYPGTMDMNYVEFQQVFICYLNERKKVCIFAKYVSIVKGTYCCVVNTQP